LEIFKHWLPSFRCSSHFAFAIIIICILSSVSDLASTKLWYVASGFYFSVEKRVKTFLSLRSFRYSRNLRNKTKQKSEIQRKKKKKKKKKGVEHLVKINHKRDVSVYLRRRETRIGIFYICCPLPFVRWNVTHDRVRPTTSRIEEEE
jgi:hypothetical protein